MSAERSPNAAVHVPPVMTATGVHKARGQQFASDNQAGICPDAFAAIAEARRRARAISRLRRRTTGG